VQNSVNALNEYLEQSGITERVAVIKKGGADTVDTLTGKTVFDSVRDMLDRQAMYNDVLATRLAEALERIGQLEEQVQQQKQRQ